MKSSHASTRIKTGKVYQDRNMQAWYRQQERIKQIEQAVQNSTKEKKEGKGVLCSTSKEIDEYFESIKQMEQEGK